jgi:phosphatidylglycerophosphatase C
VNIAFFDFDGTITHADSFTPFIYKTIPAQRLKKGKILLIPYILGYKLGIVSGTTLRSKIFHFGYQGTSASQLIEYGQKFSEEFLPNILMHHAMQKLEWHLNRGDKVVLVSASMDVYLKPWCEKYGLDLICSEIEAENDVLTGFYKHQDCSGIVKKLRILKDYNLSDYDEIYAYGDSKDDLPMLSLANKKFYQWKEIE